MCGRYTMYSTAERLADELAIDELTVEPLAPRYNVAPTDDVYAVIAREGARRLGTLRWGYLPHFIDTIKGRPQPINARADSLSGGMFRRAFERRRCLLPSDGFYEWQIISDDGKRKQPWYIHDADGAPLVFGGIWTVWRPKDEPEAEPIFSCAIVTTAAKGAMAEVHERTPLMLDPEQRALWLDPDADLGELEHVAREPSDVAVVLRPVSTLVNSVRNDDPSLLVEGRVEAAD